MTMQIMICLAILAVAVVLFSWDQVTPDVVALGVLLLQGRPEDVKELERGNSFNIIGGVDTARLRTSHAALAVIIFAMALLPITLDLLSMPVAALGGAFLMMLTGCIAPEEAYRKVEWKVLILIGALLSLGGAMEATGAGRYLAAQIIALLPVPEPWPLSA